MENRSVWRVSKVILTDVLGFQGTKELSFGTGCTVVDAPNHTGKSSLAFGMLWAVTGDIPKLARVNRQSFRLTNRHAGQNANTSVTIELLDDASRSLTIARKYTTGRNVPEDALIVECDGESLNGDEAQELLLKELGVKPGTFEGCGVVLQEHRLKLVAGGGAISEVVNDMLGLYALSELVPKIEERRKNAEELRKELKNYREAADPLLRWTERDEELQDDRKEREDAAIAEGFSPEDVEQPEECARSELDAVADSLDITISTEESPVPEGVSKVRESLNGLRANSSGREECVTQELKLRRLEGAVDDLESIETRLEKLNSEITMEAEGGDMDLAVVRSAIRDVEEEKDTLGKAKDDLGEERQLLEAAYKYLLKSEGGDKCPVCEQAADCADLKDGVSTRLDNRVANDIEKVTQRIDELEEDLAVNRKRQRDVELLVERHQSICTDLRTLCNRCAEVDDLMADSVGDETFITNSETRTESITRIADNVISLREMMEATKDAIEVSNEKVRQVEQSVYQPADKRLNRVMEFLIPMLDTDEKIENHGSQRDDAESRSSNLQKLEKKVTQFTGRLKKIERAIAEHEMESASKAITDRLPRISEIFQKVANNPDYDGLSVETKVSRDRVTYGLLATSSTMANLNDAAGHVLSEGDLSAAAMALLLGLASGDSHQMGFAVLDDPAQGMDDDLQARFAEVLAESEITGQVIVLTHQRNFAAALENAGAKREAWGQWSRGIVDHA